MSKNKAIVSSVTENTDTDTLKKAQQQLEALVKSMQLAGQYGEVLMRVGLVNGGIASCIVTNTANTKVK